MSRRSSPSRTPRSRRRTGEFKGTIKGQYNFVSSGLLVNFEGPITSQFEPTAARLENGLWNVQEPLALDGTPAGGGGGTWSAMWASDAPPAGEDPCASLTFYDDAGTPSSDAGADAGSGDAGL